MRLPLLLSLLFITARSFCQELPLYNQYIFDPYVVNPSYVGQSGFTEINLLYRYQWAGVNNAPTTGAVNLQYVASPRISLGVSVYNDEVVLLSTTSGLVTFGYRVPLRRNNIISFGLSAGAISNRIHLDEVSPEDLSDPVFKNTGNTLKLDGQFGVNYTSKKFTIGFALLRLFDNNAFVNKEQSQIKFSELQNKIVTTSYEFSLGSSFDFTPYLSYRFNSNNSFFEGTGMFSYKKRISLGGFYRQNYGPGFIIRLRFNPKIDFGYGHEPAGAQSKNYLGGSHELQLKMKLGKKAADLLTKRDGLLIDSSSTSQPIVASQQTPKPEPVEENITPTDEVKAEAAATKAETPPASANVQNQTTETVAQSTVADANTVKEPATPKDKYELVIGTFSSSSNAVAFVRKTQAKGLRCEMRYLRETGYYYVFATEYEAEDPTLDSLLQIRDKIPFKDAWYKKGIKD